MSNPDKTRTFETEIQLKADPETVWEALTSPTELARWFPLGAMVDPRQGGVLQLSWGDAFSGTCRIQEWDPPRHLRTSWMEQPAADAPGTGARQNGGSASLIRDDREAATRGAVDYFIEGDKGRTVLRLAHSGFSTSPKWDDEYDGVSRGWTYELRSLRHYLVRHRGSPRHVAWSRREIGIDAGEAWSRLMSPQGIVREGTLDNPVEGDRYALVTATGDRLTGRGAGLQERERLRRDGRRHERRPVPPRDRKLLRRARGAALDVDLGGPRIRRTCSRGAVRRIAGAALPGTTGRLSGAWRRPEA